MTINVGSQLAHYEIIEAIGAGGMGEVYLAHDRRLKRKVALKLLPTQFTDEGDRLRRFQQEAQAASALNHPNIITIYEIGADGGAHYIATEFIDGQTLRKHLKGGALKLTEALEIAIQTASALAAAHGAGIIHRDIKPENLMVRQDGIVKVLDFGIAKLAETSDPPNTEAATLAQVTTATGAVLGTPQYMSPEQARGQKVDAGTDIFSLGVVLYELIAGHPPFEGVNSLDVISAILQREPRPLSHHVIGVPGELERIISKALHKDRLQRYQTVEDLLIDLKDLKEALAFAVKQERSSQPGRRAPFPDENRSLAPAYLSDAPRASGAGIQQGAMERQGDPGQSTILQPSGENISVRSNSLRLMVQTLSRPRISLAYIVGGLLLCLIVGVIIIRPWRSSVHIPSAEAKRWFEIGANGLRDGAYFQASKAFEKAIAADDAFVLAHARLAEAFVELDFIEKAKDELLRVNAADRSTFPVLDSLYLDAIIATATNNPSKSVDYYQQILGQTPDKEKAFVLVDLARAYEKNLDLNKASATYQEAIKLSPEYATAFLRLGILYGIQHDLTTGMTVFDKAEALYQAVGNLEGRAEVAFQRGALLNKLGNLSEARSQLDHALKLANASENKSQEIKTLLQLSSVAADTGETELATNYARDAVELARSNRMETLIARGLVDLGNVFRTTGRNAEAEKLFLQSLEASQRSKAHKPEARAQLSLASLYVQQNKTEEATRYLEPALAFYQQGGYQTEAFQGLVLLARLNRNKGDYETALKACDQLLQLAVQRNDQSLIASAHSELANVLSLKGRYPETLSHLQDACRIYKALGVQRSLGYNLHSQGTSLLRLGRFSEAQSLLDEARAIADRPTGGFPELTTLIRLSGAEMALIRGRFSESRTIAEGVLNLKTGQSSNALLIAKRLLGLAQSEAGNPSAGKKLSSEAVEMSRQLSDPGQLALAQLYLAESLLLANDGKGALSAAAEAQEYFVKSDVRVLAWRALSMKALAYRKDGDNVNASKYAAQAMESLAGLEQSWAPTDVATYNARPDVILLRKRITDLTGPHK